MPKPSSLIPALAALVTPALAGPPSADPGSDYFQAGQASYMMVCFGCHQPDGQGVPGAFPPLAGSPWVEGDPARIAKIVLNGLKGPVEVKGKSYNTEMPPQGPLLDDEKLAQVLTFVRNSWGNESEPVTPKFVAQLRAEFGDRVEYWDAEELLAEHPLPDLPPATDPGNPLSGMKYALYEGRWESLPDFSQLSPTKTADLKNNLVDKEVIGKRRDYVAVVYEGEIDVPADGQYTFFTTSDDASRVVVDDTEVARHDGTHPWGEIRTGEITLTKGKHPFRYEWLEYAGQEELYVGWGGPGLAESPLSTNGHPTKGGQRSNPKSGIPLGPDGMAARIYRNFIKDAGPHAIAVGYPGAINIAWDAANMRLALLWRGPFIDAALHWEGRGAGFQSPANPNYLKLANGVPLAHLESLGSPWPTDQERASDELRTSKYIFNGYTLDGNSWPTFRYTFGEISVTDRLAPVPANGQPLEQMATASVGRTLTIGGANGDAPLYFRLARGEIKRAGDTFTIDGTLAITIPPGTSPEPVVRESNGTQELLIEISGPDATIHTTFTVL